MNVSFKGMQNVGAFRTNHWLTPAVHRDKILIQLNNNGKNKDLDDFQEVLDAYPSEQKSDSLELEFHTTENGNYEIAVNSKPLYKFSEFSDDWKVKPSNIDEKKWTVLKKITNLLDRIAKKEESIPLDKDYLESEDSFEYFKEIYLHRPETGYQMHLSKDDEKFNIFVKKAHSREETSSMVKAASVELKNRISEKMMSQKLFIRGIKSHGGYMLANEFHKNSRLILELSDEKLEPIKDSLAAYLNPNKPNIIIIDRSVSKKTKEVDFAINGEKIEFTEENLPILDSLKKITEEVAHSHNQLELPEYYLTDRSFNELSIGFKQGVVKAMYQTSEAVKEREGLEFKLAESGEETKDIAGLISRSIDRKMKTYLD